jgi:transposase
MIALEEAVVEKVVPKVRSQSDLEKVVKDFFPEEEGLIRYIRPLWDVYFRVNYYSSEEARITHSHFVAVNGEVAKEIIGSDRKKY